jgi:iron complex outermembrane receptor protein
VKTYGLTNLGIEFDPTNSKVKVIFTATNVFNVAGINSKFTDPYGVQATSTQYVPPRQLIGTLAFAF